MVKRIVVLGCPGSGKTTLAARLAADLGLTHIELDSLHWRPGWTEVSTEEFRAQLDTALAEATDGWVTCGNYASRTEGRHVSAADTVVWIDLSRWTVMRRVTTRTVRRAITRERLFGHDICEPLSNFYRWAPEKNIIRWAWVYFPKYRERYETAIDAGDWSHVSVRHLESPKAVEAFARHGSAAARKP